MSFPSPTRPFYQAIEELLKTNNLVLFGRIDVAPEEEVAAVTELLRKRYEQEARGYPEQAPEWDPTAAGWAAMALFHAAQLLLYRSHDLAALEDYFPRYSHPQTPGAALSADLCLRYLPAIIGQLEAIDVEDELLPILRHLLSDWPYSGLLTREPSKRADLFDVPTNACLKALYVDRIIHTNHQMLATHPKWRRSVLAALGNHRKVFWSQLEPHANTTEIE